MKRTQMIALGVVGWAAAAAMPATADPPADPAARFAAVDTDGDGVRSLDEVALAHEQRLERITQRLGDRYDLERAAHPPSAEEVFARLDTDANGFVSPEELAEARRMAHQRRAARRGPPPPPQSLGARAFQGQEETTTVWKFRPRPGMPEEMGTRDVHIQTSKAPERDQRPGGRWKTEHGRRPLAGPHLSSPQSVASTTMWFMM